MKLKNTLPLLLVLSFFGCSYGCSERNKIPREDSADYREDEEKMEDENFGDENDLQSGEELEDVLEDDFSNEAKPKENNEIDPREKSELESLPKLDEGEAPKPSDYDSENDDVVPEEPVPVEEYEETEYAEEELEREIMIGEEPPEEYDGVDYDEDSEPYPER